MTEALLTVHEVAEWLKVNPETVKRLARRGALPSYVIGRRRRFRRDDVETYLASVRDNGRKDTPQNT